jgi:hypothetical protein
MMVDPYFIWLTGFAGLMMTAAIIDFRRLVIPNPLIGDYQTLPAVDREG